MERDEAMAKCCGCGMYRACQRWRRAIWVCARCWRQRKHLYDVHQHKRRKESAA